VNTKQRQRLVRHIARIAERAYRRGFQQGHDVARRGDRLVVDLYRWRFTQSADQATSPTGDRVTTAVERIDIEEPSLDVLLDELLDDQ